MTRFMTVRPYVPQAILLLICLVLSIVILDLLFPLNLKRIEQHSVLVLDAENSILRGFTTEQGIWRLPIPPQEVDPLYLKMLKGYEDQRFDWHPGVDPFALLRALGQWITHGRIVSGASTLTMQTARLLEPRPRTLLSKLIEMMRALQLEWHYDKNDILAMYLTLAPYGGNLEGLRSASLAYFAKEPLRLTPAEAALLVVLPQAPSHLRPDRFPKRAQAARNKVLARMEQLHILSSQAFAEAYQEIIPAMRHPMPFHAPHLARLLKNTKPHQAIHQTFIDRTLQRTLEALAETYPLNPYGSLAILVVENRTRRVMAYIGSAGFFAIQRAGQVDMVQAIRSPGSTLKPFIYGIGFEDLMIHPETLIDDVPTRFGDYSPANFRHIYLGQISVREALQRSLNIPAVAILEQVGPARVNIRLREAGIYLDWSKQKQKPGLPLVLGGVGTTLKDLVTLYSGIANGGKIGPLRLSKSYPISDEGKEHYLLSEAASWYLARILEEVPPPERRVSLENTFRPRAIAYKTGTSYGFRDAWALGFDSHYTVGVWIGRPDGSPSPGRYGYNTAAPLLFRVFNLLPETDLQKFTVIPEEVLQVSHEQLPERLKHFGNNRILWKPTLPVLTINFPVHGSRVELKVHDGHMEDLPLVASGGKRPLQWLVNGRPIHSSVLARKAFWSPDGEGWVRITVIDRLGQAVSAEVWLKSIHDDG